MSLAPGRQSRIIGDMSDWKDYLKPDEARELSVIKTDRAAGLRRVKTLRDRAYRRMVRASEKEKM